MNAVDPTQWPATLIVALLLFLLELIHNRLEVAELRRTIQAYSDSHDTLWEEYTELKEKYDKQNTDTQDLHQLRRSLRRRKLSFKHNLSSTSSNTERVNHPS